VRKSLKLAMAGFLAGIFAGNAFAQRSAVAVPCDRACLEGLIENYFDAAIAHDPNPDYS